MRFFSDAPIKIHTCVYISIYEGCIYEADADNLSNQFSGMKQILRI